MKLGKKLKFLRKEKKLTLDKLSQISGVGKATLSRIETGITMGNLNTHLKICEALNINIGELYRDIKNEKEIISIYDEQDIENAEVFTYDQSITSIFLTKPSKNKTMLPQLLTITSGKSTPREENPPGTDKFIYCLEGELELAIADKNYTLKANSSIYFDAAISHSLKNTGQGTAKIIVVVSPVAL